VALFAIPIVSILIFGFFAVTAGGPHSAEWGAVHGVHVAIVENYRYVNGISMTAWIFVLGAVLAGRSSLAHSAAIFGTAFPLCDMVFYLPMARIAGEQFPYDQAIIVGIEAIYALTVIAIMNRTTQRPGYQPS
jgi:hypothetical protein